MSHHPLTLEDFEAPKPPPGHDLAITDRLQPDDKLFVDGGWRAPSHTMQLVARPQRDTAVDDVPCIAKNMMENGGGFVRALGTALSRADMANVCRIRAAFPEYWETYKNWSDRHKEGA